MGNILKLYEIFLACGARVGTDSRKVERGALFVALRGERFDGNMWAASALDAGASAVVVESRFAAEQLMRGVRLDDRYVVVDDTLATLQQLAAHHRKVLGTTILAITGTNGKTTTKELTAAVLAKKFTVRATEGNLNNHIGVPLTLLGMRAGELGIVEMGASARGEIAALCAIAAPNLGLITNVGRAHLEGFGGEEGVRQAKGELYDYLAAHGGTALVRGGDKTLMEMALQLEAAGGSPTADSADARAALGSQFKIIAYPAAEGFTSQLVGDYNAHNVAAAVAVGREFGVADSDIHQAIAAYIPTNNRSQRVRTARNTLTVDCYNANPSSMLAALQSFEGDTAILGEMAELGTFSAEEHGSVVGIALMQRIPPHNLNHLILVGAGFAAAAEQLLEKPDVIGSYEFFPDTTALIKRLKNSPLKDRHILIKGSRSVGLEKILDLL